MQPICMYPTVFHLVVQCAATIFFNVYYWRRRILLDSIIPLASSQPFSYSGNEQVLQLHLEREGELYLHLLYGGLKQLC